MDVISSHQAGVKEAVATSGTAMTELHLKNLSRLTPDVRLAYDGDAAGMKATERAIMMAGDLGVNLSVISDYHGAKDPDELIQKDPELWRTAVKNYRPAVDWLLEKFEEDVDLSSGIGKKEYSDVAMKLLRYVKDAVERKHYEKLVARKLDCSVEDLRAKKVIGAAKRLKKVETKEQVQSDVVQGLKDRLQAIVLYGGVDTIKGVELPEDEIRKNELEIVFEAKYKEWGRGALEKEAAELLTRYKAELNRQEVERLTEQLSQLEEKLGGDVNELLDDEAREKIEAEMSEILRKIMALKRG